MRGVEVDGGDVEGRELEAGGSEVEVRGGGGWRWSLQPWRSV